MRRNDGRNRRAKQEPRRPAARDQTINAWPGDRAKYVPLAGYVLVVFLTLIIYGQTLSVPTMNYEDSFYLVRNPYVNVSNPLSRLTAVWTEPYFANFHPLTTTTWLIDRLFADRTQAFDAHPFRVTHLTYAAIGAALLLLFFRRLGFSPILALAGAALFAAHPIHTEIVAWLSARKDLIALITVVLACLCHLRARESQTPSDWRLWHTLTVILDLLAVLSKPIAVIVPALLIAYEFCSARPPGRKGKLSPVSIRTLGLIAIFFVVGGILLLVFRASLASDPARGAWLMVIPLGTAAGLWFAAPDESRLRGFREGNEPGLRVLGPPMLVHTVVFAAGSAWTFWAQSAAGAIKGGLSLIPTLNLTFDAMLSYIGKTFVPLRMSAVYVWNSYPYFSLRGAAGAVTVVGLAAAALSLAGNTRRDLRLVAFGIFWFLIAFVPVSNLVPTSTKMSDRYLFLPTIGAIIAVLGAISWLAANQRPRQLAALVACAAALLGYTAWAYQRTEVWCGKTTLWKGAPHPDLSLWTAAVAAHPDNSSALTSLALVYLHFDPPEPERALPFLQRALELSEIQQQNVPDGKQLDISPLHQALGNAYLDFARVTYSQPGVPDAGARKKAALRKAVEYFELSEKIPWGFAPSDARLLQNLSDAREELARLFQAEISVLSGPDRDALVIERDALRERAIRALERARKLLVDAGVSHDDPDFRTVLLAPGTAYFNREVGATREEKETWYRKALAVYQETAKLLPDDPRAFFYIGLCYERLRLVAVSEEEKRQDFAGAEEALRKALTLNLRSSEYHPLLPYRALASLFNEAGDSKSALDFLKLVRQRDPVYSRSSGVERDIQTLEEALHR